MIAVSEMSKREQPFGRARSTLTRDLRVPSTWPLLDSLRGVAVLGVVGWHVFRISAPDIGRSGSVPVVFWPLGLGRLGVDLVLSFMWWSHRAPMQLP